MKTPLIVLLVNLIADIPLSVRIAAFRSLIILSLGLKTEMRDNDIPKSRGMSSMTDCITL